MLDGNWCVLSGDYYRLLCQVVSLDDIYHYFLFIVFLWTTKNPTAYRLWGYMITYDNI